MDSGQLRALIAIAVEQHIDPVLQSLSDNRERLTESITELIYNSDVSPSAVGHGVVDVEKRPLQFAAWSTNADPCRPRQLGPSLWEVTDDSPRGCSCPSLQSRTESHRGAPLKDTVSPELLTAGQRVKPKDGGDVPWTLGGCDQQSPFLAEAVIAPLRSKNIRSSCPRAPLVNGRRTVPCEVEDNQGSRSCPSCDCGDAVHPVKGVRTKSETQGLARSMKRTGGPLRRWHSEVRLGASDSESPRQSGGGLSRRRNSENYSEPSDPGSLWRKTGCEASDVGSRWPKISSSWWRRVDSGSCAEAGEPDSTTCGGTNLFPRCHTECCGEEDGPAVVHVASSGTSKDSQITSNDAKCSSERRTSESMDAIQNQLTDALFESHGLGKSALKPAGSATFESSQLFPSVMYPAADRVEEPISPKSCGEMKSVKGGHDIECHFLPISTKIRTSPDHTPRQLQMMLKSPCSILASTGVDLDKDEVAKTTSVSDGDVRSGRCSPITSTSLLSGLGKCSDILSSGSVDAQGRSPTPNATAGMEALRAANDAALVRRESRGSFSSNPDCLSDVGSISFRTFSISRVLLVPRWTMHVFGVTQVGSGYASRFYGHFIMIAVFCISVHAFVLAAQEGKPLYTQLGTLCYALGALIGLACVRRHGIHDILGPEQRPLEVHAWKQGYYKEWLHMSFKNFILVCALWLCTVVTRARHIVVTDCPSVADLPRSTALAILAFAGISGLFTTLVYCQLHICCGLELMVDKFCVRFFSPNAMEHIPKAVCEWNVTQAILRRAANTIEMCLLATQTSVLLVVATTGVQFMDPRAMEQLEGVWDISFLPPGLLVLYTLFRAAAVTEKCSHVPSLVNSMRVEAKPIDQERQYFVEYIVHSGAGFYIRGIRLNAFMVLKLAYLFGTVGLAFATQVLFRSDD